MRAAGAWRVVGAGVALLAWAQGAPAASRVYGIEHGIEGATERVLIFADGPITPQLVHSDARTDELTLPNAELDPSAPRNAAIRQSGNVSAVTATQAGTKEAPEVRIRVRHAEGVAPELVQRGTQVALEFPRRQPQAAAAAAKEIGELELNVRDAPIQDVVKQIARHTGVAVIYDETLTGRISVMALHPFTGSEALLLMDTILLMKGFAAIPTPGGPRKIVRIEGADSPFVADLAEARGDQAVTTLIRLQTADVETVLAALRPQLGQSTLAFEHAPTNAIVLAGSAATIEKIADVILALDAAGAEHMFLRPLKWAGVERTAEQIEDAFDTKGLIAVYPDTRTSTLAVRARVDAIPALKEFISKVDRPAPSTGPLHVIPIKNADPEQLASILRALQSGGAGQGPRTPGQGGIFSRVSMAEGLAGHEYSVVVDKPTHSLVLEADADTASVIRDIIGELDRPPRQVDVEATVVEVAIDSSMSLALDALLPLTDPSRPDDLIAFVASIPSGSANALFDGTAVEDTVAPIVGLPPVNSSLFSRFARSPILIPITQPDGSIRTLAIPRETAAVQADQGDIFTRMILRPRIKLISGKEHQIFVGDNVPIRTEQSNTGGDPLQTRQNIERQDTGVTLRVTPTLGEKGDIQLDLSLEVSAVVPTVSSSRLLNLDNPGRAGDTDGDSYGFDGDGYGGGGTTSGTGDPTVVGPTIRKRTIQTKIRLEHDRVAVIGYDSGPTVVDTTTGTPWLKDIPVLGWLFKASRHRMLSNHLLITVAAWRDDDEVRAMAEAMRRALGPQRAEKVPRL